MGSSYRLRICGLLSCIAALGCVAGAAHAENATAPVVITGGADASAHNYHWTVINASAARVVYIEFPHYAADLFEAPPNWDQEFINQCHLKWKDEPGKCIARTKPGEAGLGQGMAAEFTMRIAARGAMKGKGDVIVKFDDGTVATIKGVVLPQRPERGNTYLALIATGLIFALFVINNERRRRKRLAAAPAASEDDE